MKYKTLITALVLFATWQFLTSSIRNPSNPPAGNTGAPGETTCAQSSCHSGGTFTGTVSISGIPDTVIANQSYAITLTNTSNAAKAGFQLTCLDSTNVKCGTLTIGSGSSSASSGGRQYVRQNAAKTLNNGSTSWTFTWQAPATLSNHNIRFFFVSLAANGNGQKTGDNVLSANKSVVFQTLVATHDQAAQDALVKLYPSATNDVLHIDLIQYSDAALTVFDLHGRQVLQQNLTSNNLLNVSQLEKGMYLAKIQAKGLFVTKKFVVE